LFAYAGFLLLLGIFLTSTLGYGRFAGKFLGADKRLGYGYEAALGLVTLVFLGGIVNAVGEAYGLVVDMVFGFGTFLLIVQIRQNLRPPVVRTGALAALRKAKADPVIWLAAALFVLAGIWLVPTFILNPHDDLTQYLLRPINMMQTGTLGGNWFDNTGLDSLGSQSWMQAFFINHLPLTYVDAFDNMICLPLSCLVLGGIGMMVGVSRARTVMAVVAMICINPVQVNTSAKYSIVLMLVSATAAAILFAQRYFVEQARRSAWLPPLCATALFIVTAVALKSTAAVFAAVLFGTLAAAILFLMSDRNDRAGALIVLSLSAMLAAFLYAIPFTEEYVALATAPHVVEHIAKNRPSPSVFDFFRQLFQVTGYQFNQRPINTTLGFLFIAVLAIVAVGRLHKRAVRSHSFPSAFAMAIFGVAAVLSYGLGIVTTPWGFIRYATPILTAVLPVSFLLGFPEQADRVGRRFWMPSNNATVYLAGILVILMNASSIAERTRLAWRDHTASILAAPALAKAVRQSLSADRKSAVRSLQEKVPPGAKILSAILDPTYLDFRRNPGYSMYLAGLGNPWIGDLWEMSPSQLSAHLKTLGIEYLLWQRKGAYLLSKPQVEAIADKYNYNSFIARSARNFATFFKAVDSFELGPLVYSDASYLVFKLDPTFIPTRVLTSYDLGVRVDFTTEGTNPYLGAGWSAPEPAGTWTVGKTAKLSLKLDSPPSSDLVLMVKFTPYFVNGRAPPVVKVEVGGSEIEQWRMSAANPVVRCAIIPASLAPLGRIDVALHIEGPPPPAELGLSDDTRRLGAFFEWIVLDDVSKQASKCRG
jgi:hypothetical protein